MLLGLHKLGLRYDGDIGLQSVNQEEDSPRFRFWYVANSKEQAGPSKAMGPSFNPTSQTGYTWARIGQLFHPSPYVHLKT